MLIRKPAPIRPSEITSETIYLRRRQLLGLLAAGTVSLATTGLVGNNNLAAQASARRFSDLRSSPYSTAEQRNSFEQITTYNNFYEFGTDKSDPASYAHTLITTPWKVTIDGAVAKPGSYDLEDLLKPHPLEERVYRLRCVEG